jgi:hypothetical protein
VIDANARRYGFQVGFEELNALFSEDIGGVLQEFDGKVRPVTVPAA